jgi:hypothetical protein
MLQQFPPLSLSIAYFRLKMGRLKLALSLSAINKRTRFSISVVLIIFVANFSHNTRLQNGSISVYFRTIEIHVYIGKRDIYVMKTNQFFSRQ